jgi:hypothetical protein
MFSIPQRRVFLSQLLEFAVCAVGKEMERREEGRGKEHTMLLGESYRIASCQKKEMKNTSHPKMVCVFERHDVRVRIPTLGGFG